MYTTLKAAATAVVLYSTSAAAIGRAHVVNNCKYEVFLCETPADGGGYSTQEATLQPGGTWDQEYTALSNKAGWSIKLSKTEGSFGSNILQYEYTYQNDNMLWYDLSCVDGNPWDKNWMISSNTDTCNPKQQAYRFATDDAYGMQSCTPDDSITVTVCSGEDSDDSPASYSASSASSATDVAPATYDAPEPTTYSASPTTFATLTTSAAVSAYEGGAVTITEIVTEIATATQYAKRHQHHPRDVHQHA